MELQLAMDFDFNKEKAISLVEKLAESIDIIEVGTPFVMEHGLSGVEILKKRFPEKKVLADLKIADAGYYEAEAALKKGADIVTVLAVSDDMTIVNARDAAHKYGKEVMVDMLSVRNLEDRLREIDEMGADYICLHTSKDLQKLSKDTDKAFATLRKCVKKTKLAIAGGIRLESIGKFVALSPDAVIVGEGLAGVSDPEITAREMRRIIDSALA